MRVVGVLIVFLGCYLATDGFPRSRFAFATNKDDYEGAPLQPKSTRRGKQRSIPKYLLRLYNKSFNQGAGSADLIRGIFPKIVRTKRAMKLIFEKKILRNDEGSKWKRDELRVFLNTCEGPLRSSNKPFYIRIFDLFSRRLVNILQFSTKSYGWKTINLRGWRNGVPRRDRYGRVGLKLVVIHGRKKINIYKTPLRKSKERREPYFIEFLQEKKKVKIDIRQPTGNSLFNSAQYEKNNEVLSRTKYSLSKYAPFLSFPGYKVKGQQG